MISYTDDQLPSPKFLGDSEPKLVSRERIKALRFRGLTLAEAAEEEGVDPEYLDDWRDYFKVPPFREEGGELPDTGLAKADRETIKMLRREGKTNREIAAAVGVEIKSISRILCQLGMRKTPGAKRYPQEVRDRAEAMLDDGASYQEVERTLGVSARRVAKWYPGRGWSQREAVQYRHLKKAMDALDGQARTGLEWN